MAEINKTDIAPYYYNNETVSHRFVRTVVIAGATVLAWNFVLELGEPISFWVVLVGLFVARALVYSLASAAGWGWFSSNYALREVIQGLHSIIGYKIDLEQQERETAELRAEVEDELARRRNQAPSDPA